MPEQQDSGAKEPIHAFALSSSQSTTNLQGQTAPVSLPLNRRKSSSYVEDWAKGDSVSSSIHEQELDQGPARSGLHWIRPKPPTRLSSAGPKDSTAGHSRSTTITLGELTRANSVPPTASEPVTPSVTVGDYLTRFPAESLHSFSFSQKQDDFIHNRQALLKKSLDFIRDRPGGWAAGGVAVANAQAKLSGDPDAQGMMELLNRAKVLDKDTRRGRGHGLALGPMTGPAMQHADNVFERGFAQSIKTENNDDFAIISPTNPQFLAIPEEFADKEPTRLSLDEDSAEATNNLEKTISNSSAKVAAPRALLKRTFTDISTITLRNKLAEALEQPYLAIDGSARSISGISSPPLTGTSTGSFPAFLPHAHGRAGREKQAIFTTGADYPWPIAASNDLASLTFGCSKTELRRKGILELVREDKRKWLEQKLRGAPTTSNSTTNSPSQSPNLPKTSIPGNSITARLLSKPPSRETARWKREGLGLSKSAPNTPPGGSRSGTPPVPATPGLPAPQKSAGVLICGDVVFIQKSDGKSSSVTLWVQEKRGALIWVMEEISEDTAYLSVDAIGCVTQITGQQEAIWGLERVRRGVDIARLLPKIPRLKYTNTGALDFDAIAELRRYTARTANDINVPVTVDRLSGESTFRVSSFPHMAGMIILAAPSLNIKSSNAPISEALFGRVADGHPINELIPNFDKMLNLLVEEDNVHLVEGIVIPEHSFRRARADLATKEGRDDPSEQFDKLSGLRAIHRDGAEMLVNVQMRVVKGDTFATKPTETLTSTELVYALWVTYSRTMHAVSAGVGPPLPPPSRPSTPPLQPMPRQSVVPVHFEDGEIEDLKSLAARRASALTPIPEARVSTMTSPASAFKSPPTVSHKKTIEDFDILEDMGAGAYGQVKLARRKSPKGVGSPDGPGSPRANQKNNKVVIKYVTKARILMDTWTRDRRLGTVPLEIHVLDHLRRDGFRHPNIVEMSDFFEDDHNYYIEMVPHGLPGMDLFDYIELRTNMSEDECRRIFVQVASAVHFLHVKAKVVHRDIKDENVILDAEGNIKLIDFGSASYIKNGPFDVFVGTIDYAAPEVLSSHPYTGPPQDVWALGILLYTILYKENPFYSIDEILDHELRVPYVVSNDSIALVRRMLDRDVDSRADVSEVIRDRWCVGGEEASGSESG